MPLYTLESSGTAVLVVNAEGQRHAEELMVSGAMKEDLLVLQFDGKSLWTGKDSDLKMRHSSQNEGEAWEKTLTRAIDEGDADEEDRDGYLVFLVEVSDSTDEE